MILGFLAMALANAAVTLGAISITGRISSGRRSTDAVLVLLVRYVLIAAAVLVTGLARCLTPVGLGILALVGLAVWAATGEYRQLPRVAKIDLGWLLWTVIAVIVGRLLWQVWIFAPYSVDPLSYHLPKVAHWIQQGALLPYPGADVRETFPAGFELLETWWCVFLHHDVLIEMAGVEFLALGAAATAALARYVGLSLRASVAAAVLFVLTPAPLLQATACMNDGPVASVMLTTLALAAFRCHPLLIIAAVAVGVGIKPTLAAVTPGLALLCFLERHTPLLPLRLKTWGAALAMLAIGVGSFWYALNVFNYGNPLYPVGSLKTVEKASAIGMGSVSDRLNDLVGHAVYDDRDQTTVQFILTSGWGVVMFACGAVGLIALTRSNSAIRRLAAAFGGTLLLSLLLAPQGSFYLRFILFFPALGAIAASALCERVPGAAPVVWVTGVLCFLSTIRPGDLNKQDIRALTLWSWRERIAVNTFKTVGEDETVVCLYGSHDDSNGESYLAYGPGFSRKVFFVVQADSAKDVIALMREKGAHWLFAQARNGDGTLQRKIIEAARGPAELLKMRPGLYWLWGN